MLTLAHMTKRAPILGVGAGERMNLDPYGFDASHPADRLEEALQIIRMCLASSGPLNFAGAYYCLDGARLDLKAPPGKTPQIWSAARGPRMLRLTGMYGDGWYPTMITSPAEYASKLAMIQTAAREAGRGLTLPAVHRLVLVWLFQDLIQWLLQNDQISSFRPWRN
jgi:phthiodiolone/phenolphthiodiolone dimycocerosates ketoreductase